MKVRTRRMIRNKKLSTKKIKIEILKIINKYLLGLADRGERQRTLKPLMYPVNVLKAPQSSLSKVLSHFNDVKFTIFVHFPFKLDSSEHFNGRISILPTLPKEKS